MSKTDFGKKTDTKLTNKSAIEVWIIQTDRLTDKKMYEIFS